MYPVFPYYAYKKKYETVPVPFPPQHQPQQPGLEYLMDPRPISEDPAYRGSKKLEGKIAIITGGDSGIGRAAAYAMAKEGADIAIVYLNEHRDADETRRRIEEIGSRCLSISGDLRYPQTSKAAVEETLRVFGRVDIVVNNCAVQFPQESILDISDEQLENTFRTNIFSFFYMTKAALPHLQRGSSIINTASITAYRGNKDLVDYSATKGAIVTFTRSLSKQLIDKGIRVNGIAPGPIWTPLIPSSFSAEKTSSFGLDVPMKRAGQPFELAPSFVYLASDDSRYVSGQMLHINGGAMVES
jgi:NAD(P)-dependent dehydrogenase (short-subunit alcohol dehydrogenase family)